MDQRDAQNPSVWVQAVAHAAACRRNAATIVRGTQSIGIFRGKVAKRRVIAVVNQKYSKKAWYEASNVLAKKLGRRKGDDGSGMMAQPASSYGWPADSAVVTGGAVTPLSPGPVFEVTPPPPSHPAHYPVGTLLLAP